jgi:hypothetical protein
MAEPSARCRNYFQQQQQQQQQQQAVGGISSTPSKGFFAGQPKTFQVS